MNDTIIILINWPLMILSLLAIGGAAAWAALQGWSLMKAGLEVERQLTPMMGALGERAAAAAAKAESAAENGATIADNIGRLEQSITRLTVLLRAGNEASARWHRLIGFVR
jgi:hypothetical protein